MATPTYTPLATITLSSSTSSVTFSGISQSYRDLVLIAESAVSAASGIGVRLNGDSGTNYSGVSMLGYGQSQTLSQSWSGETQWYFKANSMSANTTYVTTLQIADYSASDKHKTALIRIGTGVSASSHAEATAQRWASTSAITTLELRATSGTINSGATFTLFGIAA